MTRIECGHRSILCVRLRRWPVDRARRNRPELRHNPLVLVETAGNRQIVSAACDRALASGIRPGFTLAQARALCPGLVDVEHGPRRDARALAGLGRWLVRFTPVVSHAPPDALLLDVSGCERLYGGLDALLGKVRDALAALNINAWFAIAPTPGAAWAVASQAEGNGKIIPPGQVTDALAPLPPRALRLEPDLCALLDQLGIETIGQLRRLPREALPARFGSILLERLDAALGNSAEPLVALPHRISFEAKVEFDGAVDSLEAIWQACRELVRRLVAQLLRHGCGARQIRAEFVQPFGLPITKELRLARPSRNAGSLFNLLRCACEKLESEDGFTAIRLAAPAVERLSEAQMTLLEQEQRQAEEELACLIERLCARFGQTGIVQVREVESYLPERAYRSVKPDLSETNIVIPSNKKKNSGGSSQSPFSWMAWAGDSLPRAESRGLPVSWQLKEHGQTSLPMPPRDFSEPPATAPRPLRLLAVPVEVAAMVWPSHDGDGPPLSFTMGRELHRLSHVDGPGRIAGPWWQGRDKTRDYFDAEDEAGHRFWLFRVLQTGKWYVHGMFE